MRTRGSDPVSSAETLDRLHVYQECEALWCTARLMGSEPFSSLPAYFLPLWTLLYVLELEKITSRQAVKHLRSVGSIQVY
ncbi:uncharacterized protein PST29_2473 [Pseudomonas sp. St29]|nr:uncharacterized protein PST29_2473 [Pseudomonas sp. St29]